MLSHDEKDFMKETFMRILRFGFIAVMGLLLALAGKAEASHPLPLLNLTQLTSDSNNLPTGESTFGSPNPFTVRLFASSDEDTCDEDGNCIYSLEVEIRPVGQSFTGTPTHSVVMGPKPDCEVVQYPVVVVTGLLPNTAYKWQCREVTDCGFNQEATIVPNGGPQNLDFGPWTQYNGNATAFTTNGTFTPKFLLGYVPEDASGVGRFFFFDKNPFPAAQSWNVEVRRNDSNVYLHKQTFNFPGGPPPGDVSGSGTFVLPLLDAINLPTSFEIALMVRIRVFSGLDQTGSELYSSSWLYDVHPSADLAFAPFFPGIYPPPVSPGVQPVPFGDLRPTGPNLSVLYDLFQKSTAGPQTQLRRVGHGIVGVFNEKQVHDPTLISPTANVAAGDSIFYVRPRRLFRLNNGNPIGFFDVAEKSSNNYLNLQFPPP